GLVGRVAHVWFSSDDRLVAALSHNWKVAVWDWKAGRLLHVFEVPSGLFADNATLAFNADSTRMAFVSGTRATLWEVASGKVLDSWDLPWGLVERLAFHPDGKLLLLRTETRDNEPPFGHVPWKVHPRVCRLRDLKSPR